MARLFVLAREGDDRFLIYRRVVLAAARGEGRGERGARPTGASTCSTSPWRPVRFCASMSVISNASRPAERPYMILKIASDSIVR